MPRALLVVGNGRVREAFRRELEARGHQVACAEDGLAAGETVLRAAPDVIICDTDMAQISGPRFASLLKTDPRYSHIPVVLLPRSHSMPPSATAVNPAPA